ncbi:MAG: bifunctional DNA-binding transcriptional regulator/O6-methylguanine-DNA methyltransferase Ada [Pseudomonadota bacterium]|jgi:AraC family transcriptional regulator of adaptative response/methylated-DNA-[protein]-cysteine methyltransferase
MSTAHDATMRDAMRPRGARIQQVIDRACRRIQTADVAPALSALAQEAGYSPSHFQRLFKAIVGLSPKQYAMAHRRGRLGDALRAERSVTDAIYQAGFGASSQAYATASALGMTPSAYRQGAAGEVIRCASAPCSLGTVLVATTERGVCMIEFGEPEQLLPLVTKRFPRAKVAPAHDELASLIQQVVSLVDSPSQGCDLPLDIRGTAFQLRVWNALMHIPAGKTVSYAELASRIGQPAAVRAVAQACARNGLAVAVPCHRVVRASGDASGYRWGDARKRALLDREGSKTAKENAIASAGATE